MRRDVFLLLVASKKTLVLKVPIDHFLLDFFPSKILWQMSIEYPSETLLLAPQEHSILSTAGQFLNRAEAKGGGCVYLIDE